MTRDRMMQILNGPDLPQVLPEVAALAGVPQPPDYHGEGDALEHTRLTVAALAPDADARLVWAAALHDVGKATTTRLVDGRWRAHGHDRLSGERAAQVLSRFNAEQMAEDVAWLVRHHHFALSWRIPPGGRLTGRQKRFCRHPLFPLLVDLCRADAAASYGISTKERWLDQVLDALKREAEDGHSQI
ncbi:MAG: HD domain-containing protein [Deltaproteobacteria bacterium]|nr:MAG: HD domain-containing protein [Deltaproteobacteria bacterium]